MTEIKAMTVAELRSAIRHLPGDAPVQIQSYIPGAGDESKHGGLLVHAEGLKNEITGIMCLLWSAESRK